MRKNLKFFGYLAITVILTLGLSISFQTLLAAWNPPTALPPTNVPPPIYSDGGGFDQTISNGGLSFASGNISAISNNISSFGISVADITVSSLLTITGANYINMNGVNAINIDGSGNLQFNSGVGNFIFNNKSVGINDSSPDSILDILSSNAADSQLTITNSNAGNYNPQIGFQLSEASNAFTMGVHDLDGDKFKISGTALGTNDRFVINSNGNIGINTANPIEKFEIFSDISTTTRLRVADYDGTQNPEFQLQYAATGDSHWGIYNRSNGAGLQDNSLNIWGNSNDRLTILQSGNVGVGSTTPGQLLGVNGVILATGDICTDSGGRKCLSTVSAGPANAFVRDGNSFTAAATLGTNDNFDLSFETFNDPRMTIDNLGNIRTSEDNSARLFLGRYSAGFPYSYIAPSANSSGIKINNAAITLDLVTIQNGGNVGINNSNPNTKLDINGIGGLMVAAGINLDPAGGFSLVPLANTGKMLIGWNRTAGSGEIDLISNRGGGSIGGFNFYDYTNAGVLTQLATLNGNTGALNVTGDVCSVSAGKCLSTVGGGAGTCDANFTKVNNDFCINTPNGYPAGAGESFSNFQNAIAACGNINAHLCAPSEYEVACIRGVVSASTEWYWSADTGAAAGPRLVGKNDCYDWSNDGKASNHLFHCCHNVRE